MTPDAVRDAVRADALRLLARLVEDARRLDARHLLAYLESHEAEFVAAYAATRGEPGHAAPISPFLYTLT